MPRRTTLGLMLMGVASAGVLVMLAFSRSTPDVVRDPSRPTSGIPGLTMKDVRDHKVLWDDIHGLERLRQQGRIDSEEYRYKVIELSAVYLRIEGASADEFARIAFEAVTAIRESFLRMRGGDTGYETFRADMKTAEKRVSAFLEGAPRRELFEPECGKWLRRLALGPEFESNPG